ncbi:lipopolysaccharide biosynthesis protein [Rheinheimera marina]|uniref:Lipopolysaccharide biosynthesis protein n=1 Tax=Rheinheimera marina TaxID=1774958 RepID=A0ABV9JQX9_9GAMM
MLSNDFVRKLFNNSLAHGLNFGSRWLLNLLLARYMLDADFGLFSYVYMLANLFFPAIAFGVSFYLIHHSAHRQEPTLLFNSLLMSCGVFLLLLAGAAIWVASGQSEVAFELYVLSLGIGLLWALAQALFSYLKGRQQFFVEVKTNFVSALCLGLVLLLLMFDLLNSVDEVLWAILACALVPVAMGLQVVWPDLRQHWPLYRGQFKTVFGWPAVAERLPFAWADLFAIVMTNIPFIFLALFSTLLELGQFRKLFILFMPITLLPVIFSQVFLARLSRLTELTTKMQFFRKVMLLSLPLLSLPYLLMWPLAEWLYELCFHEVLAAEVVLMLHLVLATLWLTLVKTYFEVLLTSVGANKRKASLVTLAVALTSLGYLWFNTDLTVAVTSWLFLAGNLTITLMLAIACWLEVRRQSAP